MLGFDLASNPFTFPRSHPHPFPSPRNMNSSVSQQINFLCYFYSSIWVAMTSEFFECEQMVLKLSFGQFNLMRQFDASFQSSLLEINRQRDVIIFDYLKTIQDKLTVLPHMASNLQLIPQMHANLSLLPKISDSLTQIAELMHRVVGPPKAEIPVQTVKQTAKPGSLSNQQIEKQLKKMLEDYTKQIKDQQRPQQKQEISDSNKQIEQLFQMKNTLQLQKKVVQQTQKKSEQEKINEFPQCISVATFEENNIIVDFKKFVRKLGKNYPQLQDFKYCMSQWIAVLYNQIAQKSFSGYFSRYFNHDEAKIYFTKNLIVNFVRAIEFIENDSKYIWKDNSTELIEHFQRESAQILQFIALKYPQQQISYVSSEVRQAITAMDNSIDPEFNYLENCWNDFKLEDNKLDQAKSLETIKIFINHLIDLSDSHRNQWKAITKELFTIDGKILKNQAGTKLRQNTPKYSAKEIDEHGIKIKTPEVLRIIVKWAEQLEKRYIGLKNGTLLKKRFPKKRSKATVLSSDMRSSVQNTSVANKLAAEEIKHQQKKMQKSLQSVISSFPEFLRKYQRNFSYLDSDDMKSGLLSYVLSSTASQLAINYLISLIQKIRIFELNLSEMKNQPEYNFLSFKISDLLRCKCFGTIEQIKKVYHKLSTSNKFKIYRVKNRIDTSNKDFLVNVKLEGTEMLCEIQLKILQKQADQKQGYVSHFSHLLYQLSRAKYGPIGEAVMINTHLTEFVPFFKPRIPKIDNVKDKLIDFKVCFTESGFELQNYKTLKNNVYFVCANCICFREAYCGFLPNFESINRIGCNQNYICGECALSRGSVQHQNKYLMSQLEEQSQFLTILSGDELESKDFQMPYLIYVIDKTRPAVEGWIVQNAKIKKDQENSQYSFIPTFWQYKCDRDRIISQVTKKQLESRYYLFKLKDTTKIISVNRKQLKICEQYQIDYISGRDSLLQPQLFPNQQSFFIPSVTLQSDFQKLNGVESEKVLILFEPEAQFMVLINNVTSEVERQQFLNRKKFSKSDIESLKTATHWELSGWDIDNESLEVFKQYNLQVTRMDLQSNRFIKIPQLNAHKLRKLVLQSNKIKSFKLEEESFPSLELLNLANNQIQTISKLQHKNLQHLNLEHNKIQDLDLQMWSVPKLTELIVYRNKISNLKFAQFNADFHISLDWEYLQTLQFPEVVNFMKRLDLKEKFIVGINFFKVSFPNLEVLAIQNFQFKRLLQQTEQQPIQIKSKVLQITNFSEHFPNLQFLSLQGCNSIRQLGGDWFTKTPHNLKQLRLISLNALNQIDLGAPCFLNLQILEIYQGQSLENIVFSENLSKLKILKIDTTGLSQITFPLKMAGLQTLMLKNSQLTVIDLSCCSLEELKNIDCSNNKIYKIFFNSFEKLEELNISDNLLEQLDLSAYLMPNLINIECSNNRLSNLVVGKQKNIQGLDISKNYLKQLNLEQREGILQLFCSYNQLSTIKWGNSLKQCSVINISDNNLKQLDLGQVDLRQIKELNCSHNLLQSLILPQQLNQLSQIDISYNKLTNIDFSHSSLKNLQSLICCYNLISQIKLAANLNFTDFWHIALNNNLIEGQLGIKIQETPPQQLITGLVGHEETSIWLLSQLSEQQRTSVLEEISKQINIPIFIQNGQKINLSEEIKKFKQAQNKAYFIRVLEIIRRMGKVNKIIEKDLDKMITQLKEENQIETANAANQMQQELDDEQNGFQGESENKESQERSQE